MYSIRFDELTVDFDGHFKLHGINWALGSSEHWAITGPTVPASPHSHRLSLAKVSVKSLLTSVRKHVAIVSFEARRR